MKLKYYILYFSIIISPFLVYAFNSCEETFSNNSKKETIPNLNTVLTQPWTQPKI